jgi:CubicO group peptidase (beta-lactamase class C family)
MSTAAEIARSLRDDGIAPLVAAGCAVRRGAGFRFEVGGDAGAYFDLASLTKPMTAVAAVRSGLPLDAKLEDRVPELRSSESATATMAALLSHRAGLLAHVPLYLPLALGKAVDAGEALARAADARREDCRGPAPEGGFPPVYSDVGYILAGVALARHRGAPDAGRCIEELVVGPLDARSELGTARSLEAAGVRLVELAAPTEDVAWRGGVVRGRVHDENAWALTGEGGSGHAGMFGTLDAVLAFGTATLDGLGRRGPFADARLDELTRERPGGTLRMGFDGKAPEGSSAGTSFGPRTFGHLGFTGTSLWIDPDAEIVVALLTNRVHPSRDHTAIRAARPLAHEALFQRALELGARGD